MIGKISWSELPREIAERQHSRVGKKTQMPAGGQALEGDRKICALLTLGPIARPQSLKASTSHTYLPCAVLICFRTESLQ
jgi:hypothetical protein